MVIKRTLKVSLSLKSWAKLLGSWSIRGFYLGLVSKSYTYIVHVGFLCYVHRPIINLRSVRVVAVTEVLYLYMPACCTLESGRYLLGKPFLRLKVLVCYTCGIFSAPLLRRLRNSLSKLSICPIDHQLRIVAGNEN